MLVCFFVFEDQKSGHFEVKCWELVSNLKILSFQRLCVGGFVDQIKYKYIFINSKIQISSFQQFKLNNLYFYLTHFEWCLLTVMIGVRREPTALAANNVLSLSLTTLHKSGI